MGVNQAVFVCAIKAGSPSNFSRARVWFSVTRQQQLRCSGTTLSWSWGLRGATGEAEASCMQSLCPSPCYFRARFTPYPVPHPSPVPSPVPCSGGLSAAFRIQGCSYLAVCGGAAPHSPPSTLRHLPPGFHRICATPALLLRGPRLAPSSWDSQCPPKEKATDKGAWDGSAVVCLQAGTTCCHPTPLPPPSLTRPDRA